MSKKQKTSKMTGLSTKMMRVVISGTKKKRGPFRRILSSFAIVGAGLMITLYLGIPLLLLFNFLHDWILQILGTALVLTFSEFIVCSILLNIGKAGKKIAKPVISTNTSYARERAQVIQNASRNTRVKHNSVKSYQYPRPTANVHIIQEVEAFIPMPGMPSTPNTSQAILQPSSQAQGYFQPNVPPVYHDYTEFTGSRINEQAPMASPPGSVFAPLSQPVWPYNQPKQEMPQQ